MANDPLMTAAEARKATDRVIADHTRQLQREARQKRRREAKELERAKVTLLPFYFARIADRIMTAIKQQRTMATADIPDTREDIRNEILTRLKGAGYVVAFNQYARSATTANGDSFQGIGIEYHISWKPESLP